MFDEVIRRKRGGGAAKRAAFLFGSTALQAAVVAVIIAVFAAIRARVVEPKEVEVKFLKALSPARPAPPPPPPPSAKRTVERKMPEPPKPSPLQALVQPREIGPEMTKEPDPPEPGERDPGPEGGASGGVAGGSAGGVVGGIPGFSAPAIPAVEEGPAYATAGFRKPQMAEAGCVQHSMRVPEEWMERLGVVTVKFAIGKDGVPSRFQSTTHGLADRVAPAIWRAVRSCRWIAGADAQGWPTAIWVILPIRFTLE